MTDNLVKYINIIKGSDFIEYQGKVTKVVGLTIGSKGPEVNIGDMCHIYASKNEIIAAEVVGFNENIVLLMSLGSMNGIGLGNKVVSTKEVLKVKIGDNIVGRVLDGLGNPIDNKESIEFKNYYPIDRVAPHPLRRERINEPLSLGIKTIDGLLTIGKGQRIGIFAGSGVGKSTLLGMIAKSTKADINVVALIGERGREVKEFLERDLGDKGLERSVVVVATSDQPALVRLKAAFVATAIAEYFRDQGKDVLLLMDSLTRFAMAQREIGLAIGEPPISRGYTPSVFTVLPKLLERAGQAEKGSITGIYTVLVDGDDFNEPITDAARGILDGHIVLSRKIAERNQYPAIDVLSSVSRVMSGIVSDEHKQIAGRLKKTLATYREAEDLINIGAYVKGSNKNIDYAINKIDAISEFLTQDINEIVLYEDTLQLMRRIFK